MQEVKIRAYKNSWISPKSAPIPPVSSNKASTQLACFKTPAPAEWSRKGESGIGFREILISVAMDYSDKRSMPDSGSLDVADPMFANGGDGFCCCFAPMFLRRNSVSTPAEWWDRMPPSGGGIGSGVTSGWWNKGIGALMKVREWSELVAGPRWKTFIRRFNRNSRCSRIAQRFQYDPLSYALNFDDGIGGSDSPEIDSGLGDFSSRYAITPPAKARMEIQASPDFKVDHPRTLIGPG